MKKRILLFLPFIFSIFVNGQENIEKVKSTVSKDKIEGHIYFLASDELKGRQTGTNENKIAAQYLANMLRSYGVKPIPKTDSYLQPVELNKTSGATQTVFKSGAITLTQIFTIKTGSTNYNGKAVFVNYGSEKDYKKVDVKGKYVITMIGPVENGDIGAALAMGKTKSALAKKNGALGVIEICNIPESIAAQIEHYFNGSTMQIMTNDEENNDDFSYLWVNDKNEEVSKIFTKKTETDIEVTISGIKKSIVNSQNVIGVVEGTDPTLKNEYIIYSAHYDHVGIGTAVENDSIYNGARDNAVGTVTVLSAAENIAKFPTKRSALFILFTGEEKGLLGSEWYVKHPVIMTAKGIPAPTFSMGFTSFNEEITKYYHQVTDNPDSIDYNYLFKFFQSYVLACRKIANNPKTPFWVKGDKYYEAGKKLYKE